MEARSTASADDGAPVEKFLNVVDGDMNELEVVPTPDSVRFPDPQTLTGWIRMRR